MNFLIKFRTLFHGDETHDIQKSFEEKRCYPRAKCSFDARCLLPDKTELSVLISEVSASGMRLRSERKMQPGDIIVIEPERSEEAFSENEHEGHSVKMKVIWNKKKKGTDYYVVGLHYADNRKNLQDSWAASLLKKFGISVGIDAHKRRKIRIPVDLALSVTAGTEFIRGNVRDIGISGMLMVTDKEIFKREDLRFRIGPYKHLQGIICRGRIAHKRFMSSSKKWVYGVVFFQMNEKQSELLSRYLTILCLEGSEQ